MRLCDQTESELSPLNVSLRSSCLNLSPCLVWTAALNHTHPLQLLSALPEKDRFERPPTPVSCLSICPIHYLLRVLWVLGCFSYLIFMGLTWFSVQCTTGQVVSFNELQLQNFRFVNTVDKLTYNFNYQIVHNKGFFNYTTFLNYYHYYSLLPYIVNQ